MKNIAPIDLEKFEQLKSVYADLSKWTNYNYDLTYYTANTLKIQKGLERLLSKLTFDKDF